MKIKKNIFSVIFINLWASFFYANAQQIDSVKPHDAPPAIYATLSKTSSTNLSANLQESSGLLLWNGELWSHNDSGGANSLFYFSPFNAGTNKELSIPGASNVDWEDLAQDEKYIYIGDFGNNSNGNRTDLKIYRISKQSILNSNLEIGIINFSYADQIDFSAQGSNNTDYDCEAFIVTDDGIYLFTKQWKSNQTAIYYIPKTIGTHIATIKGIITGIDGLVTGASYIKDIRVLMLCSYDNYLFANSYVTLIYDFEGSDFLSGCFEKYYTGLDLFTQVEGIALSDDGLSLYLTNEYVNTFFITRTQQLHTYNLATQSVLSNYLAYLTRPLQAGVINGSSVNQIYTPEKNGRCHAILTSANGMSLKKSNETKISAIKIDDALNNADRKPSIFMNIYL